MKKIFLLLIILQINLSFAQNNRQNIRGVLIDKLSQVPIPGAVILIVNDSLNKATQTDENGNYVLVNISPNRYTIKASFFGYKVVFIPNVLVSSGKETILDITMEEDLKMLDEVVVKVNDKNKTISDLTTNSARAFSMEEVNRYAGGRSDPARLVANFAGVSAPDDSRNDIVIRGNSPVGVLWRIEGMNVTNPNHFASVGTTGGAVSAINTNMLKSSDFFTSAFPAEYGNAISGVFDLGFRNGNSDKREHTIQFGLITGIEAMTEGPIKKGNGSSYLIGYRYSLAGIGQAMGINIGTSSTPKYQDLSFKFNSSASKFGKFTLFGILANSTINIEQSKPDANSLYGNGQKSDFTSKIGIIGLKHFKQINSKSFLSTSIGTNYSATYQSNYASDSLRNYYSREDNNSSKTGYNLMTNYNLKINSKLFVKAGLQTEFIDLYLYNRTRRDERDNWTQIWDYNSFTTIGQAYIHIKYNMNDKLTLNTGIHAQQFFLNNSNSIEPRLGLKYAWNKRSSLSLGYGLHSQIQPLNVYFLQTTNTDGSISYNNKDLDFTKSHQLVVGYDLQPFSDWRIKAEIYYQYLYEVPVDSFASSYSMLNTGASFQPDLQDKLVNNGTGKNYGAELTIEKFFSKGFYALFTSSIYESKYKGSDEVERNTAFNGKYVYNILLGKEFKVGKDKRNAISTDLKITNAGGRYFTPIDLQASDLYGKEVRSTEVYSERYSNYFRMDIKIGYILNSSIRKISQSFSLDIQNVSNNKNVFSQSYDSHRKSINTTYQLGFFPNFTYKLQF
jgi:hypothetical protein